MGSSARASHLFAATLLLSACGDDGGAGSGGAGGGGDEATSTTATSTSTGAPEAPPAWLDAPAAAVEIAEGRTVRLPFTVQDPEGSAVSAAANAPAGIEVTIEGGELVVVVGLGVMGAQTVPITLTDEAGTTAKLALSLEVTPLAWGPSWTWGVDGPEPREHATVLVDDATSSIYVMFGSGYSPYLEPLGDAWRLDWTTSAWSPCSLEGDVPPAGGSKRLGGARGSGEGWIYGGYGEGNEAFGEVYHVVAEGDVLRFEELPQSEEAPGERFLHVFGYDPGTETFAMFGGGSTDLEGDTWTMRVVDGVATWTLVDPGGIGSRGPGRRFGAFSGMDEERGRLVLFSGQTSFSNQFGQDTWILDLRAEAGPTWTEVTPASSPPGRRNGTSVWDPTGPRLLVFGGTSDGATSQPGLFAFDARPDRGAWVEVARDGQPDMRSSGFGAFAGDAAWLGFGNTTEEVYRDFTRFGP